MKNTILKPSTSSTLQKLEGIRVELEKRNKSSQEEASKELASQLMSLGNIAVASLLFGQAFSGFTFDAKLGGFGLLTWIFLYLFSFSLLKRRPR